MRASNPFRHLFPYLKKYRLAIALGAVSLAFTDAFGLAIPWLIKLAIDSLASAAGVLSSYGLLIVGAAACQGVFRYLWRRYLFGTARSLEYDLRNDFFRHLTRLPIRFFQRIPGGDIMSRAVSDLAAVREFVAMGALGVVDGILLAGSALSLMLLISPRLCLFALFPMPLVTFLVIRFGPKIRERFARVQESLAGLSSHVQENLAGIRVVQAYVQEENQAGKFDELSSDFLEKNISLARLSTRFGPLLNFVAGVSAILALFFGGREIFEGRLTLGGLTAFLGYLYMLAWPLTALGILVNQYQRGRAAMLRVQKILEEPAAASASLGNVRTSPQAGAISFRNLTFSYNGRRILEGVTGEVPPGKWITLMGKTACGKTTLANLIPRIFEPPEGSLWVDGVDVRRMDLASLRSGIGFVDQDVFLFSESIQENILFGQEDATTGEVENIVRICGLAPPLLLDRAPEALTRSSASGNPRSAGFGQKEVVGSKWHLGLKTVVGERGVTLSGGQKQRLALARALVRDPAILILDNAFSNMDVSMEERILENLKSLRSAKTTFFISHRIGAAKRSDEVWIMESGKIVERGSHQELLQKGGLYAALVKEQEGIWRE